MSRYHVGCAGQFVLGQLTGYYDDEDEAIAACEFGPVGCEVYDSVDDRWIGPSCWEELNAAKARLASRSGVSPQPEEKR